MSVIITQHADQRIRQRGRRESDLEFVFEYGTPCKKGVLLTKKDKQTLIRNAKSTIKLAEKLEGTFLACDGDTVMTAFRATRNQQKRFLSGQ